jgi:hypothetical protein
VSDCCLIPTQQFFQIYHGELIVRKKSLKSSNGQSEALNRNRTDNTRSNNDLENTTYKTKDRTTRIPLKNGGDLMCSRRVICSCSTCDTWHVTVKRREHHLTWKSCSFALLSTKVLNNSNDTNCIFIFKVVTKIVSRNDRHWLKSISLFIKDNKKFWRSSSKTCDLQLLQKRFAMKDCQNSILKRCKVEVLDLQFADYEHVHHSNKGMHLFCF